MPEKPTPEKPKKKRGRKPKEKKEPVKKATPKKRGRKPKEKYVSQKNPVPVVHEENFILHIKNNKEQNITLNDHLEAYSDGNINDNITDTHIDIENNVCMWCCHKYYTQSWGMPFININGSHKTYGQFCCVECVSAYCFDDISLTDDKKWEIYSIINNIARKIYEDPTLIVKLAAPRNSLKLLGGKYSIDEFRALNKTKDKVVKIFLPPTVSILYNIEEMTEESISCDIDNNNISKSQDNMFSSIQNNNYRLKRDKPLRDTKNTLEHCMNIEIKALDDIESI